MALNLLYKFVMARRLLLFSTICTVFLLGYFLPRWMGPKNCINSSLVEEITVFPERKNIQTCDLEEVSFSSPPPLRIQKNKILERVEALEFLSEYWGQPNFKISIVIEPGPKQKLHFREDHILISDPMLYKEGVLEKAIMQYWLGSADFMTAEIITSTIWNVYKDKRSFKKENWLKDFSTLIRYCQRGLNILQHSEYCQIQNELQESLVEAGTDPTPIIWSLSQTITEILTESFYNLSLSDKKKFLTNLVFLNSFEEAEAILTGISGEESLQELDSRFETLLNYALAPVDVGFSAFRNPILSRLASGKNYDFVIVNSDVDADLEGLYYNDNKNVILEVGGAKTLYPSDAKLYLSRNNFFKTQKIKSLSIVGCDIPRPRRLLEFEGKVDQILFVKVCEDAGQIQAIIETGAKNYVQNDSDIEFVEFNLAALKVATRHRGDLHSSAEIRHWRNWLQWTDSVYEDTFQAYRPLSPIDAVTLFRSSN